MVSAQNLTLATNSGTHAKKRDFACTFEGCSNAYTRKIHLQRHLTSHSDKKDFVCLEDNCGKAFNNNDTLKKHIRRIHRERLFKCSHEGCNRTFRKHQHLTVHSFVHTNIKPFKCQHEGCEARFQVPSKLKSHAKIHKGYTCNKEGCGRHFDKWTGLRKHLSDDHITGKKFKFITSSEPWRLCHYAICKYEHKCELCGKVYFKRHKLRVHMKSHEKIKEVFICPRENCNRSYLKPSYLELHIKNYHDGGRPYACDHPGCSKTFIHKCSLSKHQVVHEPDYVRPPPKPRKKRGLASRLSGYPDEASRLPHPKIETNTFNRACEVPGGVTSVEAAEEMDSTAQESEDVLDAAPTVTMETSGSDAGDREGKAEVREMEDDGYRGSVHL